ncbi:hypothetical protein BH23GEM11_BH23GEM11_14850 [soil metagenome]
MAEGTMAEGPLRVITVQAGSRYPDLYVNRLRRMVARQIGRPHRFLCYTDRPGAGRFDPEVEVHDLGSWGLPGYFNKLRLFDRGVTGETPFVFLDITLVIRAPMAPLLAFGEQSEASLVAVADWNYPIVNSSVLRLRPDDHTQRVWDDWQAASPAERAPMAGDQNWIDAVFRAHAPERLGFWPDGMVASYKGLRKRAARDAAGAAGALEDAVILKFHGQPKPHEVLRPWRYPRATVLRHPLRPRLWRYLAEEIRAHWR